jgi:peptide/nickel transport system permease protein
MSTPDPTLATPDDKVPAGNQATPASAATTAAPVSSETLVRSDEDRFYYATQWELMWWRFRRHKVAFACLWLLLAFYVVAIFSEFVAPYDPTGLYTKYARAEPSKVHFIQPGGGFGWPYVYGVKAEVVDYRIQVTEDRGVAYPVGLFVHGWPYKLLGLIDTDIHLFGVDSRAYIWLFGLDMLGRDVFSRAIYGSRLSLFVGLVGLVFTFIVGMLLGGISGYFGGVVDGIIQRVTDFMNSVPMLPVLMVLAGAIPRTWPSERVFFLISVMLALVNWTGLARAVRGMLLSMRDQDYALAAQVAGASDMRIITRHLLPGITSHLIMSLTISIPGMIIAETSLSFLGLGLQPPAVSWGVILQDVMDISKIAEQPWMLIPVIFIIVVSLLFNFVGDGLRDAADPYAM